MGLERTAAVMQGVSSVYETDLFIPIMKKITDLTGKKYGMDEAADRAIRIIAEHSRGVAFLIADGVLPSNEGRGYVLRRILRRASFFGRKMGIEGPFLSEVTGVVVEKMANVYPELVAGQDFMIELVETEEEKFISTLDAGITLVESSTEAARQQGINQISGEDVFRFWDTHGFPSELSAEIAREKGLTTDIAGFEAEMKKQRRRGRKANKFDAALTPGNGSKAEISPEETDFIGYDTLSNKSRIIYLLEQESGSFIDDAQQGQEIGIVLDVTPFYGEMGGQVGDAGRITVNSSQVDISNAVWSPYGCLAEGAIIHFGKVVKGKISKGDEVKVEVDEERRLDIARNHTATHLLQAALRRVLGIHVSQRGSLVAPDRLRFDFSHIKTIDRQQLNDIQSLVNEMVRENLTVASREVPYKKAIEEGAIALFDEKYSETVRVLEIGKPSKSMELCGGTHVRSTGEIGLFLITSEGSIGTGLRRIEAVTGRGAEAFVTEHVDVLKAVAEDLRSSPLEIKDKVAALMTDLNLERKRCTSLEKKLSGQIVDELIANAEHISGISVIAAKIPSSSISALREMGDTLRDRLKSAVIVLGTVQDNKPGFIAMVTSDLLEKGLHAGEIVKQVAGVTGGGGGGRADMAQAGGKDKSKIDEALGVVRNIVRKVG
jgi:alanyl-tRNA synthetase